MENLISNIRAEWPTVVASIAFVVAGACTYAVIRLVAKLVASLFGSFGEIEEEE